MFEQVVFAGGGNRCWWQAGFWDIVASRINLSPRIIVGVSAGAATACLLYANASNHALAYYFAKLADNRHNVYWKNLLRRGAQVMPHAAIYRQALTNLLGGEHFRTLQHTAPEIRVQLTRLPDWLGPRTATAAAMLAYGFEKYVRRPLHPILGRRLGFTAEIVRVRDCKSDSELVELLIASSSTPPFTPIAYRDGRAALDGGMVDNVPVDAADPKASTLVLLTRRYRGRPDVFVYARRLYVQPSVKVPISSWDYTNPQAMADTYQLGRADGARFLREWSGYRAAMFDMPSDWRQAEERDTSA